MNEEDSEEEALFKANTVPYMTVIFWRFIASMEGLWSFFLDEARSFSLFPPKHGLLLCYLGDT